MEDLHDVLCTRCGGRCSETKITDREGTAHRVPVFVRLTVGFLDEGGPVDLASVPMTSMSRAALLTPLSRLALCEKCFGEVFGLPLQTAAEDPLMHGADLEGVDELYGALRDTVWTNPDVPRAAKMAGVHARTIHAVRVGRGEATVADLPEHQRPVPPAIRRKRRIDAALADVPEADREETLRRLTETGVAVLPMPKGRR